MNQQPRFTVDVNRTFTNKDGAKRQNVYRFQTTYRTEEHTPATFLELVRGGYAYTAPFAKIAPSVTGANARGVKTPHHTENWLSSQVITLDDDTQSQGVVATWCNDAWFSQYGFAFAESASSVQFTAEKGHAIIILDKPITDAGLYRQCLLAANDYWPYVDQLTDVVRNYYNGKHGRVHTLGNICPFDVFERDILRPWQEREAAREAAELARRVVSRVTAVGTAVTTSGNEEGMAKYLAARVDGAIRLLANTTKGQNRHKRIFWAGQFIGAIESSPWAMPFLDVLGDVESRLEAACVANGYAADYGGDVLRTYRAGLSVPFPPIDPPAKLVSSSLPSKSPHPLHSIISAKGGDFPQKSVILADGQYLGEVLTLAELPTRCILDAPTGTGKSTLATNGAAVVMAVSTTIAAEQLYQNGGGRVGILYGGAKDVTAEHDVIVTTYDSLGRLMSSFDFIDPPNWTLVIDEQHNLALADYRSKALGKLLTIANNEQWGRVVFMSGTPLDMPNGADYERVTVRRAAQRVQPAQRVLYASGQRLAAVATIAQGHVASGERVLIYLESKGGELLTLTAELEAAGVAGVYHLNSDNKLEAAGRAIVDTQKVPTDCNVLITTAVLVESTNLLSEIGAAVICSPIHPAYAHQFVSRARVAAPKCYILNNGEGKGWGFDMREELTNTWRAAVIMASQANSLSRPWDSERGKVLGGSLGRLISLDDWGAAVPSILGTLHHTTESQALYAWHNPQYFEQFTTQYGWEWQPAGDMTAVTSAPDAKERASKLVEQAAVRWGDVVKALHGRGRRADGSTISEPGELVARLTKGLEGVDRRAAEWGLWLYVELDTQGVENSWDVACGLLATGKDSGHWWKRTARAVKLWGMREDGTVQAIVAAVPMGERLTREQRHQIVLNAFAQDEQLAVYTLTMKRRTWESEKARMTEQSADELLEVLFDVRKRKAKGGGRYWTISGASDVLKRAAVGYELLGIGGDFAKVPTLCTNKELQRVGTSTNCKIPIPM